MQVVRVASPEHAVKALCVRILTEIQSDHKVLWLLSGGSNIQWAKEAMEMIPAEESQMLTIGLIDERFGPVGHADSNWQQLINAGFDFKNARSLAPLRDRESFEQASARYDQELGQAFEESAVSIGQLGIGSDGHIAGILPHSAAANASVQLVFGYESHPYDRFTLTFSGLKQLTVAYALAFGEDKQPALSKLVGQQLSLADQPAQILKDLPEAHLYCDQIGEEI